MRVFISGVSGLLGGNIAHSISSFYKENTEIFGIYAQNKVSINNVKIFKADITDNLKIDALLCTIQPTIIFHCAALTNVDYCEDNPTQAHNVHVEGTKNLALWAKENNAKFIYISTDAVFDGIKGNYSEDDEPKPVNVYAKTKLNGELVVREILSDHLIIRTNIYGWNIREKNSFSEWVLHDLVENKELNMFTDVFFTPIFVNDLIGIIVELIKKNAQGLFHIGASERYSKYNFGIKLAQLFNLNQANINAISVEGFPFKAKRSKDMSLCTQKVCAELENKTLPGIELGINNFKNCLSNGYLDKLKYQGYSSNILAGLGERE